MAEKSTFQVTPKRQFLALLKNSDQQKDKLASISGELGARIKEASDNGHLNRAAFGLMVKLYRMEEDKRAAFLRSFDAYREYADEEQLFGSEHVGDLDDMARRGDGFTMEDADPEAEQQAADQAQVALNTERLERGIQPLDTDAESATDEPTVEQGAAPAADTLEDDAVAKKPSRRGRKADLGDAPGTYAVTH